MTQEQKINALVESANALLENGNAFSKSAGYFIGTSLPTEGELILKAGTVPHTALADGKFGFEYDIEANDLGVKTLNQATFTGRHYSPKSDKVAIQAMECRTKADIPALFDIVRVAFKNTTKNVLIPKQDIRIKFSAAKPGTIFLPVQKDAWDGKTMNCTRPNDKDYALLELSKA